MEFSDDEQEMLAKQARKQKLKSAKGQFPAVTVELCAVCHYI